jgi:hypothetical protein
MLQVAVVVTLMLAARPSPPPVKIYLGPLVRDGFIDMDRGVRDSINDLRQSLPKEIGKKRGHLVDDESASDIRIYVVGRGTREGSGSTTTGTVIGNMGLAVSNADNVKRLEVRLRAGTYERAFVAEKGAWLELAYRIAKDISAWLDANRDRIPSKP